MNVHRQATATRKSKKRLLNQCPELSASLAIMARSNQAALSNAKPRYHITVKTYGVCTPSQ
jgi:hypothetical protein